eukprot:4654921-Ditylum_brightwellii.AAC.1
MRKPDMIKVSWDQLDSNWTGGMRALTVSIMPDNGVQEEDCAPPRSYTRRSSAKIAQSVWPVLARSSGNQVDCRTGQ